MNLPSKIKIVKSHEGLPPVGTVMTLEGSNYSYPARDDDKLISTIAISIALECGIAEEVKEAMPQWQAWGKEKTGASYFFLMGSNMEVERDEEELLEFDSVRFSIGNYFPTKELAEQARYRVLETLKQFHKEHKTQ
jgi:hypothetical protein